MTGSDVRADTYRAHLNAIGEQVLGRRVWAKLFALDEDAAVRALLLHLAASRIATEAIFERYALRGYAERGET